jgi:hypothetical protein
MRDAGEAIMKTYAINEARKPPRIGSLAMISGTLLCVVGAAVPALGADLPDDRDYRPAPTYYRDYSTSYNNGCYRCTCCGGSFAPAADRYRVEERVPYPVVEREVARPIVERIPVSERHWVQRDYIERSWPSYGTSRYAYQEYPGAYQSYPGRYRYSYYYPGSGAESYTAYESGAGREPYPVYERGPGRESYRYYESGPGREPYPAYERGPGRESYRDYESGPGREPYRSYESGPGREPGFRRGLRRRFGYDAYPPVVAAHEYGNEPRTPYHFVAASAQPYEYYRPAYEYEYYKPVYEYDGAPRPPAAVPAGYYIHGSSE